MTVSEYCKLAYDFHFPISVSVSVGIKNSTKKLYVVGYNGDGDGKDNEYILFRDTKDDSDSSVYRTFYMKDVRLFYKLTNEMFFNGGVLPYEIDGQPFVSR